MTSFVFPFIFVKDSSSDSEIKSQITKLFTVQAAIIGAHFLITLIFFYDNTSYLEKQKKFQKRLEADSDLTDLESDSQYSNYSVNNKNELPFSKQMKAVFTDPCYVCMFLSGSFIFGSLGGTANTLNAIVSIWGYPQVIKIFNYFFRFLEVWSQ